MYEPQDADFPSPLWRIRLIRIVVKGFTHAPICTRFPAETPPLESLESLDDAPMYTARDLMHRPVLDIATGRELGKVKGILIDASVGQAVALRVDRGLLQSDLFIRWVDFQGRGPDAFTVPSEDRLVPHKEVDRERAFLDELHDLPVFTENGERLGEVTDYRLESSNGMIAGFDIRPLSASRSLFGKSDKGIFFVPREQITTIGKESLVVADSVRESLHGPAQEIGHQG